MLLPDDDPDELEAGVVVLEYKPPDAGVLVPVGIAVLDEDEELEEELEDGLVGHRLLPVTGTTGVVVPAAPLGLLGEGVPIDVLELLGVDVPELGTAGVVVPELGIAGVVVPELVDTA